MVPLKEGNICEIVDIHKTDAYFEDKKNLKRVKVQLSTYPRRKGRPHGFVRCWAKLLRPVSRGKKFREGSIMLFIAVKLKKIKTPGKKKKTS